MSMDLPLFLRLAETQKAESFLVPVLSPVQFLLLILVCIFPSFEASNDNHLLCSLRNFKFELGSSEFKVKSLKLTTR